MTHPPNAAKGRALLAEPERTDYYMLLEAMRVLRLAQKHLHTIHANAGRDADWKEEHGLLPQCAVARDIAALQSEVAQWIDAKFKPQPAILAKLEAPE